MKVLLVVFLVGVVSAFVEGTEWETFKQKHAKSYANPIEEVYRMKVYADNKARVEQHMKEYAEGKHSYTLALNKFADLTSEEFARGFNGLRVPSGKSRIIRREDIKTAPDTVHAPDSLDWRNYGVVNGVQDQGYCGSYPIASTGAFESAWAVAGNSLLSLSSQQVVDCSTEFGNNGCSGGTIENAFKYMTFNGGLESASTYQSGTGGDPCGATGNNAAHLSDYGQVPYGDEAALKEKVATFGPTATSIDASHFSFQLYSGGVYDEPRCSSNSLDHDVLIVGYGVENGKDYWLVKNSWGTGWGLSGYIKMSRNASNQCGIATAAIYAVI